MAFNERSLREAEGYVGRHVGRWVDLLLGEGSGEGKEKDRWTKPRNMADQSNYLFFDIMADLSFGKSWDIKEPGENGLRSVPGLIHGFVDFSWIVSLSPFRLFLFTSLASSFLPATYFPLPIPNPPNQYPDPHL